MLPNHVPVACVLLALAFRCTQRRTMYGSSTVVRWRWETRVSEVAAAVCGHWVARSVLCRTLLRFLRCMLCISTRSEYSITWSRSVRIAHLSGPSSSSALGAQERSCVSVRISATNSKSIGLCAGELYSVHMQNRQLQSP